jgi:hypothetical protein
VVKHLPVMNELSEVRLVLYSWIVFLVFAVLLYLHFMIRDRMKKRAQFRRRDHLLDQAALRIKEFSLLHEEIWRKLK